MTTEEKKIKKREYYENNKDKYKKWRKKWHMNNVDTNKENLKEWRKNNKEHIKEYSKRVYESNKIDISEKKREWRRNNKDKINEYRRRYQKNRFSIDPLFKMISSIRNRISLSFSRNGYSKKSSTYEILGCSFIDFKLHLQNLFIEDMSWENQGKWHLDHIIPISSAKSEDDVIKLNHYTNFQPLWAEDNIKKSNL